MKKITLVLLGVILVLALVTRFWKLATFPEAIDEDEMALGYYAYSLVQNGTDEYGHKFPIYFESAGDYKYGLYSYFDAVPVYLFGLSPTTTRSAAAFFGSISVILIFFLALEIFKKEKYGLIAAFVLAVNPTHIHFSRVAYNNVLGGFFAILSVWAYLIWLRKGKLYPALIAFTSFVLAIFSYQAYRIFLPAVFVLLPLFLFKSTKVKKIFLIIFSVIIVLATALSLVPAASRARSQDWTLLINQPQITEQIAEDGLAGIPPSLTRIFDNKLVSFALGYSHRYFAYFDPSFLFISTTNETQRHSIPNLGLLYLIEAPFLLIGFLYLRKKVGGAKAFVPLILLFAAPLAAATVIESVSTTRALALVFGYVLIVSLGIFVLLENKRFFKVIGCLILAFYIASFVYFFHEYTIHKIYHHPWYSDYGFSQMVGEVGRLESNYRAVAMSHGHYMPYLFYNKVNPSDFISNSDFLPLAPAGGVPVARFGKIYFNMPFECPPAGRIDVLYVCFGYKVPAKAHLIDVIRFRDGQPAILLVDFGNTKDALDKLPERVEYSSEIDKRFPSGILPENYATFWPAE